MRFLRRLHRGLRALIGRPRLDTELDAELEFHLAMETERQLALGHEPAEARRRARLAFGAVQDHREATRDARGLRLLDDLWRDLRHGARSLGRRPGHTAVVLLTLGVGVGGSAAIFGAVDGVLLTPLPYPEAERVMGIWQTDPAKGFDRIEPAPANFLDLRERARSFRHLTAMEPFGFDWQSDEGPVYLATWLIYEGFFETFGTQPLLGRLPRPDEYERSQTPVVVLGHAVWQRRFGGDSGVIGRVYQMDEQPRTVVAVMPAGFAVPSDDVVWSPKVLDGWERQARSSTFYTVYGRLADGVTEETATAELEVLAGQLRAEHPRVNAGMGLSAVPLREQIVGETRGAMLLLLGAVTLVLVVVVANVGSLQLARAVARSREFALRGALGAGRGRVLRQLFTESLIVAAAGAVLGFVVARVALAGIRSLAPAGFPRLDQLRADGDVLAFAVLVSAIAVVVAAALPARVTAGLGLHASLGEGARGTGASPAIARAQSGLVIAQVGLSLVLLIGAGLLTRSFFKVLDEDRGFDARGAATFTVQSWSHYPDGAARAGFVEELVDRIRALPGVRAAGMLSAVPLAASIGSEHTAFAVEGTPLTEPDGAEPLVNFVTVSPGGLEALGVPTVAGRGFDRGDRADALPVAVVNRAFAARYFGETSPIGKRIAVGRASGGRPPAWREVVGVVGDIRRSALSEAALPTVYLPHPQSPTGANAFVIRGEGSPAELVERAKQALWEISPTMPVYHEATLADLVGASVRDRSFLLAILAGFAAMALGLAAAGIFGLMSNRIGDRTREIGVRMAFGAGRHQVLGMVLRQGTALAVLGIGVGALTSVGLTRLLASRLYRVAPLDPATFGVAALVLLATALLATWYPAWRASTIDPIRALGSD